MHSVIASVSSDHSAPLSVTAPSPSAASTIARFVIDFEPGIAICAGDALSAASASAESGTTSISSGSGIIWVVVVVLLLLLELLLSCGAVCGTRSR